MRDGKGKAIFAHPIVPTPTAPPPRNLPTPSVCSVFRLLHKGSTYRAIDLKGWGKR